jgi:1,4-alpha-glucan branching enzyme
MVSRPTYVGGLGFGLKWDMGWMHDMLEYMALDPVYRKHHHEKLTFRMIYAFSENFVLPLSHDEVVYGKGSLFGRMVGAERERFGNLRLLLSMMYAQPGKKLLFMGGEFGQSREWNHESSLDWHLVETPGHQGVQRLVADLNRLYRAEPALHEEDCDPRGFAWVDPHDHDQSVVTFLRRGHAEATCLVACNFTPVARHDYRVGVPVAGEWREVLNSDALTYGGTGAGNWGKVETDPVPSHGHPQSVRLTLPPLAAVFLVAGTRA